MKKNERLVYAGKIVRLTLDTVSLPNGNTA